MSPSRNTIFSYSFVCIIPLILIPFPKPHQIKFLPYTYENSYLTPQLHTYYYISPHSPYLNSQPPYLNPHPSSTSIPTLPTSIPTLPTSIHPPPYLNSTLPILIPSLPIYLNPHILLNHNSSAHSDLFHPTLFLKKLGFFLRLLIFSSDIH